MSKDQAKTVPSTSPDNEKKKSEMLLEEAREQMRIEKELEDAKPPKLYTWEEVQAREEMAREEEQDLAIAIFQSTLAPMMLFERILEDLDIDGNPEYNKQASDLKKMLMLGAFVDFERRIKYSLDDIDKIKIEVTL